MSFNKNAGKNKTEGFVLSDLHFERIILTKPREEDAKAQNENLLNLQNPF